MTQICGFILIDDLANLSFPSVLAIQAKDESANKFDWLQVFPFLALTLSFFCLVSCWVSFLFSFWVFLLLSFPGFPLSSV